MKLTDYPKYFYLFLFVMLCSRISWFMTMPFMAVYFSGTLHADPVTIGLIIGGGLLSSCIAGLFLGGLVDRFNSKTIFLLASIISSIILIAFSFKLSLIAYGILNLFIGMLRALMDTSTQSITLELLPEAKRSAGLNLRYTIINISATIGPLFGGFLINKSASVTFLTAAIIYLFCAILTYFLPNIKVATTEIKIFESLQASTKLLWLNNAAKIIFLIEAVYCIGFAQIETTLPQVMSTHFGQGYIHAYSWLLAINAIMVVFLQIWINRIIDCYSNSTLSIMLSSLFSIAFFGFAFSQKLIYLIISMIIFSIGEVIGVGLYNKIVNQSSTSQNRGAYFGILSFALIGFPIGTTYGGILLKNFGGTILFASIACIGILVGAMIIAQTKYLSSIKT